MKYDNQNIMLYIGNKKRFCKGKNIRIIGCPCCSTLIGLQAQTKNLQGETINNLQSIPLDTLINDSSKGYISLNNSTGVIQINKPGRYYVNWSINIEDFAIQPGISEIKICLKNINGTMIPTSQCSCIPVIDIPSHTSESGIITVSSVPTTLQFSNTSGSAIQLSNTEVQLDVSIIGVK